MPTSNQLNTLPNTSFNTIPFTQITNNSISSIRASSPVDLATRIPHRPSFLSSGIPKTPKQVVVLVYNSEDIDEDYDTDNEISLFYN